MTESITNQSVQPESMPPDDGAGFNVSRAVIIAAAVLVLLLVGVFVIALLIARGDVDRLGSIIEIARDLFIIFLALEGILIILALAVLIIQVARLINLLQTEVKPVLKNTQETLQSAKGTVDFVGDTVAGPVIRASAFFAGLGAFMSNWGGIRRAVKHTQREIVRGEE